MARSTADRKARKLARAAATLRMALVCRAAREIVLSGSCPLCHKALRRNLALAGWWQCSQFGADGFRADASLPSCEFQCFTE